MSSFLEEREKTMSEMRKYFSFQIAFFLYLGLQLNNFFFAEQKEKEI